jgi:hypothetical protein
MREIRQSGSMQNLALLDISAAICPPECDVHFDVEGPEGFAAFWPAPGHHDAESRDYLVDHIGRCGGWLDVPEPLKAKADIGMSVRLGFFVRFLALLFPGFDGFLI